MKDTIQPEHSFAQATFQDRNIRSARAGLTRTKTSVAQEQPNLKEFMVSVNLGVTLIINTCNRD